MRALPSTSDVVIVGAGPAGLALGCVLAREGVPFLILDRLPEGRNTSRAAVVHARTLEVLEELGVSRKLCSAGLAVPRFTVRDGDHVLLAVRFDQLPSRYPYTLMVPQDVTETVLLDRLRELGGDVCRPCEVADLRRNGDGAALSIVVASGASPRTVQARYVIGADGMHSLVRERSGIGFEGGTYEEAFVLADARMSWPLGAEEVTLFFSPEGLVVVAPLPGGRHRVVAAVDDAPEEPGLDEVQALLDRRGAGAGPPGSTRSCGVPGSACTIGWRADSGRTGSSSSETPLTCTVRPEVRA
jgi:2-polyprenyl-6-methoxyphenol hydroxylase-like FAD-dependent oxidoreductase